jgi:hypothetical protein
MSATKAFTLKLACEFSFHGISCSSDSFVPMVQKQTWTCELIHGGVGVSHLSVAMRHGLTLKHFRTE